MALRHLHRHVEKMKQDTAAGQLDKGDAHAGIKAVEAWHKATSDAATMSVVGELRGEVARLMDQLGKQPKLRSIP